jgi:hypothetical protein
MTITGPVRHRAPVTALVGAIAALAIAGCVSSPTVSDGPDATASATTSSQVPPGTPQASPDASNAADPLVGTWTSGEVSCAQWDAAIARAYTAKEISKYDKDPNTHVCPATFKIRFRAGHQLIFINDELGWDGLYRVTGPDTLESGDTCAYCWLYRFRFVGETLAIDLVKDGDPVDPVLDGIVQTGIYESAPFTRVP